MPREPASARTTEDREQRDHASSTRFPIIRGHENLGVVAEIGAGGAEAFDGTPLVRAALAAGPAMKVVINP